MKTNLRYAMAVGLVACGVMYLGATSASAHWFNEENQGAIVDKLVSAFKLKKADVEKVFVDHKSEIMKVRHEEMTKKMDEKLASLVKYGKLTEAQRKLIVQKHAEMSAKKLEQIQNWKTMTPDKRRSAMNSHREEMEDWANKNGIDLSYVLDTNGYGRIGKGMMWK
jgi:ribonuclease BN (tRNA processing enzyme)